MASASGRRGGENRWRDEEGRGGIEGGGMDEEKRNRGRWDG